MKTTIMNNFEQIVKTRKSQFEILQNVRPIQISNPTPIPATVTDLASLIENKKITEGCLVEIRGILSNFTQLYWPQTYMPTIPRKVAMNDGPPTEIDIGSGVMLPVVHGKMELKMQSFQLPIETIPSLQNNGNWRMAFLYPENFDGFILQEDKKINKNNLSAGENCLELIDKVCPILIIYDQTNLKNLSENAIQLTAQLRFLDSNIVNDFGANLGDERNHFHKNLFTAVDGQKKAFCLILTNEIGQAKQTNFVGDKIEGNIMVELCFEGIDKKINITDLLRNSIPNIPRISPNAMTYPPYHNYGAFMPLTDVSFVLKEPSTVSMAIRTKIGHDFISQNIEHLREHLFLFVRNINTLSNQKYNLGNITPGIIHLPNPEQHSLFGSNLYYAIEDLMKELERNGKQEFFLKWVYQ